MSVVVSCQPAELAALSPLLAYCCVSWVRALAQRTNRTPRYAPPGFLALHPNRYPRLELKPWSQPIGDFWYQLEDRPAELVKHKNEQY